MEDSKEKKSSGKKKKNQKRHIACFIGIIVSTMVLLSLFSYSPEDQASGDIRLLDLWKVFTNDEVIQLRAQQTQNLLGLLGAIISNWLINSTIGYVILILPFLGLVWSIALLRQRELQKLLILSSHFIGLALIVSSIFGILRVGVEIQAISPEWSGVVGDFIGSVLQKLIGVTGASIFLLSSLFVLLILLADLDMQRTLERLKDWSQRLVQWSGNVFRAIGGGLRNFRKQKRERELRKIEIKGSEEGAELSRERVRPTPFIKPIEVKDPDAPEGKRRKLIFVDEGLEESREVTTSAVPLDIKKIIPDKDEDLSPPLLVTDVSDEEIDYVLPSIELLEASHGTEQIDKDELEENAKLLRAKLSDFGVEIDSISVTPGPVVTLYELVPASGVKISRIESLEDDIALALKARGIRIIAPIPGKGTVGVEIPNHHPSLVRFRSVINTSKFRDSKNLLPIAMGKTISGEVYIDDLTKMPHLLIAGATGSGKSIGINTILMSLIYRLHPSDVKFVIIDPKKIELSLYAKLSRHFLAVSPDIDETIVTSPQSAVAVLKSVELEMEKRYEKLSKAGVRNIADYNEKLKNGRLKDSDDMKHRKMPYLIVVIDELADLMLTAARDVEEPIARLAQLARAVGIHLVLATQRPSVDVITGVIKANFSARIAYQVASKTDSRTILDMNGAEQLLGNGDMLYLPSGLPKPVRLQNAFISTEEVERIVNHIAKQAGYSQPAKLPSILERKKGGAMGDSDSHDDLFEDAARIIVRHQQGSVSLLQRRLKVGYSRAARLVDELEAAGIVGPFDGSKAREVLVESEAELEILLRNLR